MEATQIDDVIGRIVDRLQQHADVEAMWLFGSTGCGEGCSESDFDVAVLGKKPLAARQKKALIEQLARLVGRPIDVIDLQAAHGPVVGQVLRHGKQLFCDDSTLHAELMKRWMFDQADWMPLRRRILTPRRTAWVEH